MPKKKETPLPLETAITDQERDDEMSESEPELLPETDVLAKELDGDSGAEHHIHKKKKHKKNKNPRSSGLIVSLFSAIFSSILKVFRGSGIASVLTSYDKTAEAFRSTWLYGIFFSEKSLERINRLKIYCRRVSTDAVLPKKFASAASSLLLIRCRIYGLILLFFGATTLAIHYGINSTIRPFLFDSYAPFIGICVILVSLFFVFSNETLSTGLSKSLLLNTFIFDLIGVKRTYSEDNAFELPPSGACLFGILFGALTLVIPIRTILIALLAIIYAAIVIKSPEAGIISIMLMAPFAALEILEISIAILSVSYIFKALCGKRTFKFEFPDLFVALFLLAVFSAETVSFGGIGSPHTAVIFISVYFITVSILRSDIWFKRAIRSITLGGTVMAIGAILLFILGEYANSGVFASFTAKAYRETASQVLLYTAFIPLAAFITNKGKKSRLGNSIVLLFIAAYLALVLPTPAMIGCLVALALFLILYNVKAIFPIALIALIQPILNLFGVSVLNFESLSTDKHSLISSNIMIRLLSRFGFIGIGSAESAEELVYSSISVGGTSDFVQSDTLVLGLALELGYIGAIVFLVAFFFILQSAFSYGRNCSDKTDTYRIFSYAGMSGLIAAFVHGLWHNIWVDPRMSLIFWLLAGLTVSAGRCSREKLGGDARELLQLGNIMY